MTMERAKLAAKWGIPVISRDVKYARISALSIRYSTEYEMEYRRFPAERAEAELEDFGRNSITIAKVRDVEPLDSEDFERRIAAYEAAISNVTG